MQGLHRIRNADETKPPHGYPDWKHFSNWNFINLAVRLKFESPIEWSPEVPPNIERLTGIEYRRVGDRSLQLDIYRPRGLSVPVPALIFIHGGYWQRGKRSDYARYLVDFAAKGYITASVDYRLSGEAHFPAAVEDVKCAVKWIRAHAADYMIDPEHLVCIGGSAGGHLAMMAAWSPDSAFSGDGCSRDSVSGRVQAVVDLYGPVDLTTRFFTADSMVSRFIGKSYQETPPLYEMASPRKYISADDPPVLIMHGTLDINIPVSQSDSLKIWLDAAHVPNEYHRIPGWAHTMDGVESMNRYYQSRMDAFFQKYVPLPK